MNKPLKGRSLKKRDREKLIAESWMLFQCLLKRHENEPVLNGLVTRAYNRYLRRQQSKSAR